MKELTFDQKLLLCELIDGYAYPRFLCQCDPGVDTEGVWDRTKEFLEDMNKVNSQIKTDIVDINIFLQQWRFCSYNNTILLLLLLIIIITNVIIKQRRG